MADSGLVAAVERVGDRWTLLIIEALLGGPMRYSDLQEAVAGISPNILAARLKQLEAEAIVLATPYQDRPQRFQYELTASGQELAGALRLLADWGTRHATDDPDPDAIARHDACGTAAEARWWCPTCDVPLDEDEATLQHF